MYFAQVWGANAANVSGPPGARIDGGGQAAAMRTHGAGVFGIMTTPVAGAAVERLIEACPCVDEEGRRRSVSFAECLAVSVVCEPCPGPTAWSKRPVQLTD